MYFVSSRTLLPTVMAGLDSAIHVSATAKIAADEAWITGTSPVMTAQGRLGAGSTGHLRVHLLL
jgi:hypothetical protein